MRRFLPLAMVLASCAAGDGPQTADPDAAVVATENRFVQVQRRGYADNAVMRFYDAEGAYREASIIAGEVLPDDEVGIAEQQVFLALNKSNLGEVTLAQSIFDQARTVISAKGGARARIRLALFHAQHLMNIGRRAEAAAEAREAARLAEATLARLGGDAGAGIAGDAGQIGRRGGAYVITGEDAALLAEGSRDDLGLEVDIGALSEREKLHVFRAHALFIEAAATQATGGDPVPLVDAAEASLDEVPDWTAMWLRAELKVLRAVEAEGRGDLAAAEGHARKALALTRRFAADERPEALAHLSLGRILVAEGRPAEGRAAFREGVAILSRGGRGVAYDELGPYFELLSGESGLEAADEAFLALQQLRNPVTAETMARLSARLAAGDGPSAVAIRSFQDAERRTNRLTARIDLLSASGSDPNALAVARRDLRDARAALAAAQDALDEAAPNYGQIVDGSADLTSLQAALGPGEVFLVVRLGPSGGTVAAVSAGGFRLAQTGLSEGEADTLVSNIHATITDPNFDVAAARRLYDGVIGPVAAEVAAADVVVVAPEGPLLSIPPGLMARDEGGWLPGTYDYGRVAWLGLEKAVSMTLSPASFLGLREAEGSTAPQPFRAFGGFVPPGPGSGDTILASRGANPACRDVAQAIGGLTPLPGTLDEVQALRVALGQPESAVTVGAAFTDTAITGGALGDYRVIHLASHGLLPISAECLPEPAIATSLGAPGQSDALLDAGEVADLALDADLVVLSACDTGGSGATSALGTGFRGNRGESLSGLVRAFFFAGARNVVASHWLIPDQETVDLMTAFYGAVAAGASPAEAMRTARAALISADPANAHPYFWSSFSVIGDPARQIGLGGATAGSFIGREAARLAR